MWCRRSKSIATSSPKLQVLRCMFLACITLAGCGGSADKGARSGAAGQNSAPIYAIASLIFGDEGSATYVNLLPSLETRDKVALATAREFPQYAPAETFAGKIYIGSGESPTFTRFDVSDQSAWTQEQTLSFGQYTSSPLDASIFINARKALVPFDKTNHLIWNPDTFAIGVEVGAPESIPLTRGELAVYRGYGHALNEDRLYQPYYWSDESFHAYSETSQVLILNTQSDQAEKVVDISCPHLHIVTRDDDGNVYLSNGQGSIAPAVITPSHPKNCFARIERGQTDFDPSSIVYFRDLTEGREGSNLFYIGDGVAFFNVYHAEREDPAAEKTFEAIDYSANYHLWTLDLGTMQAKPMEGIGYAGGQFVAFRIDGRTFVTIPAPDYSSTEVYEVFSSGRAEKRFDVEGWAFKIFRVR